MYSHVHVQHYSTSFEEQLLVVSSSSTMPGSNLGTCESHSPMWPGVNYEQTGMEHLEKSQSSVINPHLLSQQHYTSLNRSSVSHGHHHFAGNVYNHVSKMLCTMKSQQNNKPPMC